MFPWRSKVESPPLAVWHGTGGHVEQCLRWNNGMEWWCGRPASLASEMEIVIDPIHHKEDG